MYASKLDFLRQNSSEKNHRTNASVHDACNVVILQFVLILFHVAMHFMLLVSVINRNTHTCTVSLSFY